MPPEGWPGKGPPASLSERRSIFLLIRLGPLASHSSLFRPIAGVLKCITRSRKTEPARAGRRDVYEKGAAKKRITVMGWRRGAATQGTKVRRHGGGRHGD